MRPRKADLACELTEHRRRLAELLGREAGFRALWEDAAHLHALVLGLAEAMAAGEPGAVEQYRAMFPK